MHAPSREADALTVGEAPSGLETEALGEDAAAPSSSLTPPVKNEGRNEGFREWPFLGVSDPVALLVLISIGDGLPSAPVGCYSAAQARRGRSEGCKARRLFYAAAQQWGGLSFVCQARSNGGGGWGVFNFQRPLGVKRLCHLAHDL